MISDKLQTAFNRALVPEMNCYFFYQPLFSFYQGTVEIMRHGVILHLVLESRLRHLRFWLICNITWDTNKNKNKKRNLLASSTWPNTITIRQAIITVWTPLRHESITFFARSSEWPWVFEIISKQSGRGQSMEIRTSRTSRSPDRLHIWGDRKN